MINTIIHQSWSTISFWKANPCLDLNPSFWEVENHLCEGLLGKKFQEWMKSYLSDDFSTTLWWKLCSSHALIGALGFLIEVDVWGRVILKKCSRDVCFGNCGVVGWFNGGLAFYDNLNNIIKHPLIHN